MPKGKAKTEAAPMETEVGASTAPTQGSKRVRFLMNMTYYRGRFFQAGEELEVTPEELEYLAGYVQEV